MSLRDYGWDSFFASSFEALSDPGLEPGRILTAHGGSLTVATVAGERPASVAGKLKHRAAGSADLPAVGDWVTWVGDGAGGVRIERVLERRTSLSRKVAGKRTDEQVVAANVDTVFLVVGLDGDFSLRRVERLLTTAWRSGARPVVVLNKCDLAEESQQRRLEVEGAAPGVRVLLSSCVAADGVGLVGSQVRPRETAVLIGSSGVGKSSLINRLMGESRLRTRPVRQGDDRGRHTTTHRELFRLPGGGLIIDSPGIREIQLWTDEESLAQTFEDLGALAAGCRYRDCAHEAENGCEVLAAVEAGHLSSARLESFRKLQKEQRYLERRQDESAQRIEKQKWRAIHREMRRSGRHRGR